jgi:hypothetical protein
MLVFVCLLCSKLNVLAKREKTRGVTQYNWHLNLSAPNSVFGSVKYLSCPTELTFILNLISKSHLGFNYSLTERNIMPLVSICEQCNEIIFFIVFNKSELNPLQSLIEISYTVFILYVSVYNNRMCTV